MKQDSHSGYEEISHTADVALRIWSENWPGLVHTCFLATRDLLGCPKQAGQIEQIPFTVRGSDRLVTLIAFLNEILFLFEQAKLPVNLRLQDTQDETLGGMFMVKEVDTVYHQIKAVTFHGGNIQENQSGLSVIVVYDL